MRREAVVAAGGGGDVAVRRHDLRGRRHALHRLIQVLVERIAAVRSDDDVEWRRDSRPSPVSRENAQPWSWAARTSPQKKRVIWRSRFSVTLMQKSIGTQRAVVADSRLRRIPLQQPPGGLRIANHARVVVAHDRGDVGHAGKDGLCAAGESGHEMRLDEAEDDASVGVHVVAVQQHRLSVLADPGGSQRGRIVRVVIDDAVAREHVAADHRRQLRRRVGPVRARCR